METESLVPGENTNPAPHFFRRGFVLWSNDPEALKPRLAVHQKQIELVRMMHHAGVPIMAGSDFSDWGIVPGIDFA